MRYCKIFLILLACFVYGSNATAQTKACIDWSKVYGEQEAQQAISKKEIVRVNLFRNDTEESGDDWLSPGIADLIIRYLNTDPSAGALSENSATRLPPQHPQRYQVTGLFQHIKNSLRIFVQLRTNKGTLLAQFVVETPYPTHKQFFVGLREAAEGILKKIGRKKMDATALLAIQNETDSVQAYENVIKGKMSLESYDPNKIEVGLIWFQEARREDTHYIGAYRGYINAYGFLSLYNKQNGEPYSEYLEATEKMLRLLKKQTKSPEEKNRFVEAYPHYVTGTRALAKGDIAKAVSELEQAARLVSEDPLTAYSLAQGYDKMGKKEKGLEEKKRAEAINPCLKEK